MHSKYLITFLLLMISLVQASPLTGHLFHTTGDHCRLGKIPKNLDASSFPIFSKITLKQVEGKESVLLEGLIIDPMSKLGQPGTEVYAGYGFMKPKLIAVSDQSGKISIEVKLHQVFGPLRIKGLPRDSAELSCILIGDPSTKGMLSRYYDYEDLLRESNP